jgi:predicted P-loop ATPase
MSANRKGITVIDGGKGGGGTAPPGGGDREPEDWRLRLVISKDGSAIAAPHNLMLILEHDEVLSGLFWLDEFGNRIVLDRQPPWTGGKRDEFTEVDAMELAAWLGDPSHYGMTVGVNLVLQSVEAMARRRKRHTVREYLDGLKWDGAPRVERLFVDRFGAEDNDYSKGVALCVLVSAVSRILWQDPKQPSKGSKVDFMLVLEGLQGAGKTTAVLELFGAEWYAEATESPAHKDFYQTLRGRWGVEIGEMDSFSKADVAKVKQAITTRFDVYRPSYGRTARSFRRECVFIGTTNKDDYLRDESGARRFLPLKVGNVDIPAVIDQRDQLWAEAVQLFRDGHEWWRLPADAQREQDARYQEDAWTEPVAKWLAGKYDAGAYESVQRDLASGLVLECTSSDLLRRALHLDTAKHTRPDQMRVGAIMSRLRWPKFRPERNGVRVWTWYRPDQQGASDAPA